MKKSSLILFMSIYMSAAHLIQSENTLGNGAQSAKQTHKEEMKMKRDTSKSEKIVKNFRQSKIKFKRKSHKFSGTWKTSLEELFPLFCPAREADWIPGWDCQLTYTESGYAEDKVVFKTERTNPAGEGIWTFTGFKLNEYVEFVKFQQDMLTHAKIILKDNKNGTVTATWDVVLTALTEKGNKEIDSMSADDGKKHIPIVMLIEHYLATGTTH